ncbi:ras-related protein Rab-1B-like [Oscarella lobularis]|uniref:ras-related protein Rab-1B-like n=1 Tax=Oscarella lobularis TaxID=121494 RepID=UPI003313F3B1
MGACCGCLRLVDDDSSSDPIVEEEKEPQANGGNKTPDKERSGEYGSLGKSPPRSPKVSETTTFVTEEPNGAAKKPLLVDESDKTDAVTPSVIVPRDEANADETATLLKEDERATTSAIKVVAEKKKKMPVSVLLMGPSGVGKTCLIDRMILGKEYVFDGAGRKPTAGTRLSRCTVELPLFVTGGFEAPPLEVSVWDVGGMTMSSAVMRTTLRKKDAILWVYSQANAESVDDLRARLTSGLKLTSESQYMALVGNKSDLSADARLGEGLVPLLELAKERDMEHYVVSAKRGTEAHALFFQICFTAASQKYGVEALRKAGGGGGGGGGEATEL